MTSSYRIPSVPPVMPLYYPPTTHMPRSHSSRRNQTGNSGSISPQHASSSGRVASKSRARSYICLRASGSRGRSTRRKFVFGTPPDYIPTSPPEELIRRGRERARTLSTGRRDHDDQMRGHSHGREWNRFGPSPSSGSYPEPRISRSHSRSPSHPRSGRHRHRYRDPVSSRPTHSRRRSLSLPPRPIQGYQSPSTAPNAPFQQASAPYSSHWTRAPGVMPPNTNTYPYGAHTTSWGAPLITTAPLADSRNHTQKTGFFSQLFGLKPKETHGVTRPSPLTQPQHFGYVYPGTAYAPFHNPYQGLMYPQQPIVPYSNHRNRTRRRSH